MKLNLHFFCSIAAVMFFALSSHASGLREKFIHPDKTFGLESLSLRFEGTEDDCSIGCSATCVQLARRIVSDCGASTPPTTGTDRPDFQQCVTSMKSYYGARSGTSGNQDSEDAIAYCISGASAECAVTIHAEVLSKRQGTTGTQDRTDAALACQNGATASCVITIYGQYKQRSGTTSTQDANDAIAVCQRKALKSF